MERPPIAVTRYPFADKLPNVILPLALFTRPRQLTMGDLGQTSGVRETCRVVDVADPKTVKCGAEQGRRKLIATRDSSIVSRVLHKQKLGDLALS